MSLFILLLALVWIAVDFTALIFFYFQMGFWATVALMAGSAVLGVFLFKWQMGGVWRQFKERLSQAALPGAEAADAMLLFAACCLLIAPFPLMDLLGLLLMIPPLRRFFARRIRNWVVKRFEPGQNSFVFQIGGVATTGWPPPAYSEFQSQAEFQSEVSEEGLESGSLETGIRPPGGPAPASLADSVADEIEEGEFRSVPSSEESR